MRTLDRAVSTERVLRFFRSRALPCHADLHTRRHSEEFVFALPVVGSKGVLMEQHPFHRSRRTPRHHLTTLLIGRSGVDGAFVCPAIASEPSGSFRAFELAVPDVESEAEA